MPIEDVIRVSAAGPPGARIDPADLGRFAPSGNGVNMGGMPILPWGGPPSKSPGYALYEHVWDPFLGAPPTEATGGTIYWGRHASRPDLDAVFRLLDVRTNGTDYLAFVERAADVGRRGFATQLRLVSGFALDLFGVKANLAPQPVPIGEALWRFTELERETELDGTLGGDGDWASETLGFGFLVENSYRGVYRIWSRPWLITK